MTRPSEPMPLTRRRFVQGSVAAGSLFYLTGRLCGPGPCACAATTGAATGHLIPADKGLSEAWRRSLVERGRPEIWRGRQLRYIGMPIGGIACGQLYLAGDGRLWLWDIFKCNFSREPLGDRSMDRMTMCGHYTHPVDSTSGIYHERMGAKVEQGFAVAIRRDKRWQVRPLNRGGFEDVAFRGEYPVGRVRYADRACPVKVSLEAFSPFVPLDLRASALPATVMAFTVTNPGRQAVELALVGWLQNAVNPYDHDAALGRRVSVIERRSGLTCLFHTVRQSTDVPAEQRLDRRHGYGSMALSLFDGPGQEAPLLGRPDVELPLETDWFDQPARTGRAVDRAMDENLVGALGRRLVVEPGRSLTVTFLLTWYFPYYQHKQGQMARIAGFQQVHRHYRPWFKDAADVAAHVADRREHLLETTRLWNRTWYDSTLPWWLLDRCFIPTDALATQTVHWFDNGRFWGWEGVECCPGTCTHVWNYSQAPARLFPQLERDMRRRVDYGLSLKADGGIAYRGEFSSGVAVDGQGGVIMRTWREHTMSPDTRFLESVWPQARRAIEYLVRMDGDDNGLLEGLQANTLDAAWEGPMAWISSIYCGALRAGAAMAEEMGDADFARRCRQIADRGLANMVAKLFNGEYFIHLPPDYRRINTNKGCHIDQVLGQSWACQYGLERVLPARQTCSALESLWKYNFTTDAGGYARRHTAIRGHRTYALPGEAGLMMTTWPHGGDDVAVPGMEKVDDTLNKWQGPGGYFDENMTGFEYQVAAHMLYEGRPGSPLVEHGLAVARAIHDRYAPDKRNPYNEIECSDHYARAMAAYGVFLGACGFSCHGPRGYLAFAPKIRPEHFKAAFTAPQGWGSFAQRWNGQGFEARLDLRWGRLRLTRLGLKWNRTPRAVTAELNGRAVKADLDASDQQILITFTPGLSMQVGQSLTVRLQ